MYLPRVVCAHGSLQMCHLDMPDTQCSSLSSCLPGCDRRDNHMEWTIYVGCSPAGWSHGTIKMSTWPVCNIVMLDDPTLYTSWSAFCQATLASLLITFRSSLGSGLGRVKLMNTATCSSTLAWEVWDSSCTFSDDICSRMTEYCLKVESPRPAEPWLSPASLKSSSVHASSKCVHKQLNMPTDRCNPGIQTCKKLVLAMLLSFFNYCAMVQFTFSKGMSKRGSPMALLYSLAFLKSPPPCSGREAWSERRVSSVRSGDRPLCASGTASLALVIVHHKQQCRPAITESYYMYSVFCHHVSHH